MPSNSNPADFRVDNHSLLSNESCEEMPQNNEGALQRAPQKQISQSSGAELLFNHQVQHFFRRYDGGGKLVAVDSGRSQGALRHLPTDRSLDQCVGLASRRNSHLIIGKFRERNPAFFQQLAQRLHKCVVTTVSGSFFRRRAQS